jgi:hypothetical protein
VEAFRRISATRLELLTLRFFGEGGDYEETRRISAAKLEAWEERLRRHKETPHGKRLHPAKIRDGEWVVAYIHPFYFVVEFRGKSCSPGDERWYLYEPEKLGCFYASAAEFYQHSGAKMQGQREHEARMACLRSGQRDRQWRKFLQDDAEHHPAQP